MTTITTENAAEKPKSFDQFKIVQRNAARFCLLFPTSRCPSTLPTQRCFGLRVRNLRRWEAQLLEPATNIQQPFGRFAVVFPEPQARKMPQEMAKAYKNTGPIRSIRFYVLGFTLAEYICIKSVSVVFFG